MQSFRLYSALNLPRIPSVHDFPCDNTMMTVLGGKVEWHFPVIYISPENHTRRSRCCTPVILLHFLTFRKYSSTDPKNTIFGKMFICKYSNKALVNMLNTKPRTVLTLMYYTRRGKVKNTSLLSRTNKLSLPINPYTKYRECFK